MERREKSRTLIAATKLQTIICNLESQLYSSFLFCSTAAPSQFVTAVCLQCPYSASGFIDPNDSFRDTGATFPCGTKHVTTLFGVLIKGSRSVHFDIIGFVEETFVEPITNHCFASLVVARDESHDVVQYCMPNRAHGGGHPYALRPTSPTPRKL